ncbi:MgtC/SapB family protein [Candidatus Woesearchaeota archaeon]|nr:MgtC/SapB family protein [Candidatus Woesearchaeota archaeon]
MVTLDWKVFADFLIAIALGAIIGLEREVEQQRGKTGDFAGLRTFVFITMLGALVGYLSTTFFSSYTFIYIAFFGFTLLAIASYAMFAYVQKKAGATTEVTAILAFIIGMMVMVGFRDFAVVVTVFIAVLLALRPELHAIAKRIEKAEIFAGLEFAVISLVILPFLPNYKYSPLDVPIIAKLVEAVPSIPVDVLSKLNVFNPYKIWLMVVFISGISFVGYILSKLIGAEKGIGMTGLLGGITSSTAVTTAFTAESKRVPALVYPFVLAVVVACSIMFFRVLFEVLVVNPALFKSVVIPILMMGITGFIAAFVIYRKQTKEHKKTVELDSPFALIPAIKFALFFVVVLVISKLGQILFGTTGIFAASFISGLADVDAITLSVANLAAAGDMTTKSAVIAIVIAVSTNTAVKGVLAYFLGAKKFGRVVATVFSIVLAVGIITAILV